jgi:hypothetical protein
MVEISSSEDDRLLLETVARELPRVRELLEEFLETFDILGDREFVERIKKSEMDEKEGRLLVFKELIKELGLGEKEI